MLELTEEVVWEAAKKAVADKPEGYVYINEKGVRPVPDAWPGVACQNWHDTEEGPKPGCLVGTILHDLGLNIFETKKSDGSDDTLDHFIEKGEIQPVDGDVRKFLATIQELQDDGHPWHAAISTGNDDHFGIES